MFALERIEKYKIDVLWSLPILNIFYHLRTVCFPPAIQRIMPTADSATVLVIHFSFFLFEVKVKLSRSRSTLL